MNDVAENLTAAEEQVGRFLNVHIDSSTASDQDAPRLDESCLLGSVKYAVVTFHTVLPGSSPKRAFIDEYRNAWKRMSQQTTQIEDILFEARVLIPKQVCWKQSKRTNRIFSEVRTTMRDTALSAKIRNAHLGMVIDADADAETAQKALNEAIKFSNKNLGLENPRVMISTDGYITLQWSRDNLGAAIMFVGDGLASFAFKRPGRLYAENGLDVPIDGSLPVEFVAALNSITR